MDNFLATTYALFKILSGVALFVFGIGLLLFAYKAAEVHHIVVGENIHAMEMIQNGATLEDVKREFSFHTPMLKVEINGEDIDKLNQLSLRGERDEVSVYSPYEFSFLGVVSFDNLISYSKIIE